MAREVEELTGITPQYVVTTGFDGFEAMVDDVGGLTSAPTSPSTTPTYDLTRRAGPTTMDGREATAFARARDELPATTSTGWPTTRASCEAILDRLRAHEDDEGFIEGGALAAAAHLDTNLSPTELYRFAQALTQIDPRAVDDLRVIGTPDDAIGASVVHVDEAQASGVGADAADDATLEGGCRAERGGSAQSGLAGQHDRLGPVGHLELHEDVARVVAHRLGRDSPSSRRSRRSPARPR